MTKGHDYVGTLEDIPARHRGVIFEQIQQASLSATFYMRAMGLALPNSANVPTHAEVFAHIRRLTNNALASYFTAKEHAVRDGQASQAADEIWGEEDDELFSVSITGLSKNEGDGFTLVIGFNLLYPN